VTSNVKPTEALRDTFRTEVREVSAVWWWFLILGIVWTGLGMFVLSYRVGSLATVAALVGVALNRPGFHAPSGLCEPVDRPATRWA
jgi:uncharacterized membrane protein HdeD (DUF308 family)